MRFAGPDLVPKDRNRAGTVAWSNAMIGFVKIQGPDNNKLHAYYCSVCGAFIADSSTRLRLNGADQHSFVNPSGILCNFMTFMDCENVFEHEDLFVHHSWFPGYGWRFLTCSVCFQHLGWKYDALADHVRPSQFFGVLRDAVKSADESS